MGLHSLSHLTQLQTSLSAARTEAATAAESERQQRQARLEAERQVQEAGTVAKQQAARLEQLEGKVSVCIFRVRLFACQPKRRDAHKSGIERKKTRTPVMSSTESEQLSNLCSLYAHTRSSKKRPQKWLPCVLPEMLLP